MIYIDNARIKYRGMLMCHMIADDLAELHAMASTLGIRKHFQDKPGKLHYDVCSSNRSKAIALGAIPISTRELIIKLRKT
jgi:hypothetical protein